MGKTAMVSHAPGLLANGQGDLGLVGEKEASRPGLGEPIGEERSMTD